MYMHNRNDIVTESYYSNDVTGEAAKSPSSYVKLILDLVIKLNETFVTARELNDILNAVLAGTTSGDGLGFNRAFLFLVDEKNNILQGRFGLGPLNHEEAVRIWSEITREHLGLFEILDGVRHQLADDAYPMNVLARSIGVALSDRGNVLMRSLTENRAFLVTREPRPGALECGEICNLLGTGELAVAPLYSRGEKYGVVVADNLYTGNSISDDLLHSLHLFTGLASIAIYQSSTYKTLESRMEKLREVNEAIEDQKNLLVETEKFSAIGRLLDRMLHEIRNPLSAIGGISRILRRRESDDGKLKYFDAVIRETDKIEKTLAQVAEMQDIGPMAWEMIDLTSVVELTASVMKADREEAGVAIHQNYPADEVIVRGDRERLCEALLYIVQNSLEAMPDGGIMVIAITRKGSDADLRISDSGLGIARGHLKKADNPFFTTKLNALGLGLSRAKRIIQLHGGQLTLNSNRIGGTTCVITLPRPLLR